MVATMENITVNLDNLTAEEREQLMKLVEKGNKPKSKIPHPTKNDRGYIAEWCPGTTIFGGVYTDEALKQADENGVWFPTAEEAKEEITRRKMLTKWKRLSIEAGEEENPWDCGHSHHYVYYEINNDRLKFGRAVGAKYGGVTFPTELSLSAAVIELGEDNVKKYILGVKE